MPLKDFVQSTRNRIVLGSLTAVGLIVAATTDNQSAYQVRDQNDNITAEITSSGHIIGFGNLSMSGTIQFNDVVYTFPPNDGNNNQVLTTDGGTPAVLTWETSAVDAGTVGTGNALSLAAFPADQSLSGSNISINAALNSISLVHLTGSFIEGTTVVSGATLVGSDLNSCDTIDTDANGVLSCGTDANTQYTAGEGLELSGTSFSRTSAITGTSLTVTGTVSGSIIRAQDALASSGTLAVDGVAQFDTTVTITQGALTDSSVVGDDINDDTILSAKFGDEDWGDMTVSSNSVTLDPNTVDSSELVDGGVDLSHMSSASVDSDNIVDGTILEVDLNADNSANDEDILTFDSTGSNFAWIAQSSLDWSGTGALQSAFDDRYVNTSGDTMTGNLILDGSTLTATGVLVTGTLSASGAASLETTLTVGGNITQDAGTTLFMGGLLDATGDVDMDYGSADIDDHTFTTDGTGTNEFVIPEGSIDSTEILNDTIANADMADNSIDSAEYVDGSIDLAHMSSASVDSDNIVDATIDFVDIKYDNTLAGNPTLAVDECFFIATTGGGGFICEGSAANTNEQIYQFPDVDGADTTNFVCVDNTQVTSIDGDGLAITSGELDVDLKTAGENGVGSTASVSGLEFESTELTMLQGCSDNEILKWDEGDDDWNCEADATGGGGLSGGTANEVALWVATDTLSSSEIFTFNTGSSLIEISGTLSGYGLRAQDFLSSSGSLAVDGIITLGDGSATAAINTSDWDVSATGDMTNIGAITMDGTLAVNGDLITSDGVLVINATSATSFNEENIINVGQLDVDTIIADGATLVFGDNTETIQINSSDWDISTVGDMTNIGSITADGTITSSAAASFVGNLYDADGAVDLDIGSGDVTDVTVTTDGGAIILDGDLTQDAGTTLFMGGLLDATGAVDMDYGSADITDHTFIEDGGTYIMNNGFTAANEDLGSTSAEWNDLFLNDGGIIQLGADQDVTITHVVDFGIRVNLDVEANTMSGRVIHSQDEFTGSGTLAIDGQSDLQGALNVGGTAALQGVTIALTLAVTGKATFQDDVDIVGTASGDTLHAEDSLSSSGTLVVEGAVTFQNTLAVTGVITATDLSTGGGIIFVNSSGDLADTAAGNSGEILIGQGTGTPVFRREKQVERFVLFDANTPITTGSGTEFIMGFSGAIIEVHAQISQAATGVTLDVLNGGTSIFSTKLTTDDDETGSDTAATPAVIDTTANTFTKFNEFTFEMQVTGDTAGLDTGTGLVLTILSEVDSW